MCGKFSVSFSVLTPESVEHGVYEECGMIGENMRLADAFKECGKSVYDARAWDGAAFTNDEYGHGTRAYYEQGREEIRTLHAPHNITPSSLARLRRALKVT